MEFIIDRSKWRCGGSGDYKHGSGSVQLLNDEGYKCCLGFISEQMGVKRECLLNVTHPSYLPTEVQNNELMELMRATIVYHSFEMKAVGINDNSFLDDKTREEQLTSIVEQAGHTIKFVGEYTDEAN